MSASNGVVRYSGRTGRPPKFEEILNPAPKVAFVKTPMVHSALTLAGFSWLFVSFLSAAIIAVAFVGVASILQLMVLKRHEVRFAKAQATGSVIPQLRVARLVALALVISAEVFFLVA